MRKTINLDSHTHGYVVAYAKAKGITMSAAVSELILRVAHLPEMRDLKRNELGHLVFPEGCDVGRLEMVKEASEDELIELSNGRIESHAVPQRLKPDHKCGIYGTAEAVPLSKTSEV